MCLLALKSIIVFYRPVASIPESSVLRNTVGQSGQSWEDT